MYTVVVSFQASFLGSSQLLSHTGEKVGAWEHGKLPLGGQTLIKVSLCVALHSCSHIAHGLQDQSGSRPSNVNTTVSFEWSPLSSLSLSLSLSLPFIL